MISSYLRKHLERHPYTELSLRNVAKAYRESLQELLHQLKVLLGCRIEPFALGRKSCY